MRIAGPLAVTTGLDRFGHRFLALYPRRRVVVIRPLEELPQAERSEPYDGPETLYLVSGPAWLTVTWGGWWAWQWTRHSIAIGRLWIEPA